MIEGQLEKLIERELNNKELIDKFMKLAKQKGWRYSSIRFTDVEIAEDKIAVKVLAK